MNIKLTIDQQNRLITASSGVFGDERENLTDEQVETITQRINEVLYELHVESPEAFSTFAYKDAKGKIIFSQLKSY